MFLQWLQMDESREMPGTNGVNLIVTQIPARQSKEVPI